MITPSQKIQVQNYLQMQRLPFDVQVEIRDHFEQQLESLQIEKDLSFEEAFLRTKIAWKLDFRLVKKSFFPFGKVPRLVKEIQKETQKKILAKSLSIAVLLMALQFISAKFLQHEYYLLINGISYILVGMVTLWMIIAYLFSKLNQERTRAESYYYTQILNIFLVSILLGMFGVFTKLPINSFDIVYDFINGINEYPVQYFIAAAVSSLFKKGVAFYLFFMLMDREQSIRKIKSYQNSL